MTLRSLLIPEYCQGNDSLMVMTGKGIDKCISLYKKKHVVFVPFSQSAVLSLRSFADIYQLVTVLSSD